MMRIRLNKTKEAIGELHGKLSVAESASMSAERRLTEVERAVDAETTSQRRLLEISARLIAKKHLVDDELVAARSKARDLRTVNSVSSSDILVTRTETETI